MNLSFAKYQLRLRDVPFPSPRLSPRGRGRIASRSGTGPDALVCRETRAAWLPPHEPVVARCETGLTGAPFPLTPTLSPRERENRFLIWSAKRFWFVRRRA